MNGSTKLLFETVAKVADINVLWDPEYQPPVRTNIPVEFDNATLEEALDYLGVITKSFWKPLSAEHHLHHNDNPNKRRDYEEQVAKVFYLSECQHAAGTPGNRQRGALGGRYPALLPLQRAERHHRPRRSATRWRWPRRSCTIWTSRKAKWWSTSW